MNHNYEKLCSALDKSNSQIGMTWEQDKLQRFQAAHMERCWALILRAEAQEGTARWAWFTCFVCFILIRQHWRRSTAEGLCAQLEGESQHLCAVETTTAAAEHGAFARSFCCGLNQILNRCSWRLRHCTSASWPATQKHCLTPTIIKCLTHTVQTNTLQNISLICAVAEHATKQDNDTHFAGVRGEHF